MPSSPSSTFRPLAVLASFAAAIYLLNPSMVVQAVTVGGEIFLQGDYIEVGIHQVGSFGTVSNAPAGFHPKPELNQSSGRLGFVVDPGKDGWTAGSPPQSGDYFLPGFPEEGWTVEWTSGGLDRNFNNYGLMFWLQIPKTSLTETSSGDTRSAVWVGHAAFDLSEKLKITKTIHFKRNEQFFIVSTVMTNVGTVTLNSVEFMRNVDPDQEQPLTGNFATRNYVANAGDRKLVVAKGLTYGITLGLGTIDSRAVVSTEGLRNRDPDPILDSPVMPTAASPQDVDQAIALAYRFGSLAPGQSVSFDYAYILNEDDLVSALTDLGSVSILQPTGTVSGNLVLFQATTTDVANTTKLDFYIDGEFVGADFTADAGGVFEAVFDSRVMPNGTINLKVVATFADGRTVEKTSSASIDNSGAPIAFATPTAGNRFAPATTIPVEIAILNAAHRPVRVSFFRESASSGSLFLGQDTSAPFTSSFDVNGLPDDETVIIKAVGTDFLNRSTTIQVAGSVALPSFSVPFDTPDDACICTPLLMNSQAGAAQHWWLKAGPTGAVDMTVYAVAANSADAATVETLVYDAATNTVVAGPVTTGYPVGTLPLTETGVATSFSGVPGGIYRVQVTTPAPTPSRQSHYRLVFRGAEALGAASPTSPSFEPGLPGRPVRWKLNRSTATEPLRVRIFTTGVPLTEPTQQMLYRWIDPSGVASDSLLLSVQRPSPLAVGIDTVVSAPPGPAGTWTLEVLHGNDHYRLDKQTGVDRTIYLAWDSFGTSTVTAGVTPDFPVDVTFTNVRTGEVLKYRMLDGGAQELPVGSYSVSAIGIAGQPMNVSQPLIDVLCDTNLNLSFEVPNTAPDVSAGGPYSVSEGGSVVLTATGSDPDGDAVTYAWDTDYDGIFETAGASITFSAAALDGPSTRTVAVRATDARGLSANAVTVVDVLNVAPAMTLTSAAIDEGGTATLAVTVADPGVSDTHQVVINWGDGAPTVLTLAAGVASAAVSHVYPDDNPTATPFDIHAIAGTVSDDDGSVGGAAASVRVSNLPPSLSTITAPAGPHAVGMPVTVSASYTDPGTDTVMCSITWGDGATAAGTVSDGSCTGSHAYTEPGVYTLTMTLVDDDTGSDTGTFQYVVVSGGAGFVTGGGWFDSAAGNYHLNPTQSGRAHFRFNARHRDGEFEGQTEFHFGRDSSLNFHSSSYDWLVVSGRWALYVGSGTINGSGDYAFLASVVDGRRAADGIDRVRMKIWNKGTGAVIYDNNPAAGGDYAVATAPINSGSVVIH